MNFLLFRGLNTTNWRFKQDILNFKHAYINHKNVLTLGFFRYKFIPSVIVFSFLFLHHQIKIIPLMSFILSINITRQRNWVFATNSDFLITITLEPNVADLRYFKLWILLDQIIWVWNIKGLQHRVLIILRFKYLILFQRLNSFARMKFWWHHLLVVVFYVQCINCTVYVCVVLAVLLWSLWSPKVE